MTNCTFCAWPWWVALYLCCAAQGSLGQVGWPAGWCNLGRFRQCKWVLKEILVAYAINVVTIIVRMVKVIPQIWNVARESSITLFNCDVCSRGVTYNCNIVLVQATTGLSLPWSGRIFLVSNWFGVAAEALLLLPLLIHPEVVRLQLDVLVPEQRKLTKPTRFL